MNLDEALQTFIAEARELLEQMEDALLCVEQTPDDADTINAIFRAAHTIKGSAGLFGFDHVVGFTHVAENVLDRVRSGTVPVSSELVALFLAVCDHLAVLVSRIAEGTNPDEETQKASDALAMRLRVYLGDAGTGGEPAIAPSGRAIEAAGGAGRDGDSADTDHWHISLRFGPDVLRHGMDPLSMIRYLGTFGRIVHIVTLVDAVPALSALDPETGYLGFEISFDTDANKATIEGAFEFVRDDASIRILPPRSKITEYLRLIGEMPEEELRLGEILVRCGTLTRTELEAALSQQSGNPPGEAGDTAPHPLIGEVLVDRKLVQPPVVAAALDKQKQAREHKAAESGSIRVNADKLDEHINLIGELIIASAGASLIAQHAGMPELLEAAARLRAWSRRCVIPRSPCAWLRSGPPSIVSSASCATSAPIWARISGWRSAAPTRTWTRPWSKRSATR